MAVEFGAKLYLKDNMYATLKKNLGLQREFSEQIDKTNASMQQMGRTRVNATINATDNASGVVESVRQTVNSVGNTTVSPEVSLQDNASGVIGAIQDTLDIVNTTTATPEVEVEDNASPTISEVESRVHRLGNVRALTRAEVDDQATEKVERITQRIKDLTKKVFSPVIKLKDLTVSKENVLPLISSIKETIFTGLGNIGIDTGALQTVLDQLFNVNISGDGFKGIFDSLKNGVVQAVNIVLPYVSGVSVDTTQSNGFASKDNPDPDTRAWKQSQITYTDGLKAGDMVLVQKLNDNNKYVIIARVVEA